MDLKVTAERLGDFKGAIQVRLLFTPPNLNALPAADLEAGKNEVLLPVNAQPNAALKTWKICVVGMADVSGQLWVSSELVDLTVGEPYLTAATATRLTSIRWEKRHRHLQAGSEDAVPGQGQVQADGSAVQYDRRGIGDLRHGHDRQFPGNCR